MDTSTVIWLTASAALFTAILWINFFHLTEIRLWEKAIMDTLHDQGHLTLSSIYSAADILKRDKEKVSRAVLRLYKKNKVVYVNDETNQYITLP